MLRTLRDEIGALETELIGLDSFIRLNLRAFRKITKKCDKRLHERVSVWLGARLAREAFCEVRRPRARTLHCAQPHVLVARPVGVHGAA